MEFTLDIGCLFVCQLFHWILALQLQPVSIVRLSGNVAPHISLTNRRSSTRQVDHLIPSRFALGFLRFFPVTHLLAVHDTQAVLARVRHGLEIGTTSHWIRASHVSASRPLPSSGWND